MGFGFRSKELSKLGRPTAFANDRHSGNQCLASQRDVRRQIDGWVTRLTDALRGGQCQWPPPVEAQAPISRAPHGCLSPPARVLYPPAQEAWLSSETSASYVPGSHSSLYLGFQHSSQIQESPGWLIM